MTERPYRSMRVDELDRLFAGAPQNAALLNAILTELDFRTTSRAHVLKRRLSDHLANTRFVQSDNEATAAQEDQSEANRMPPTQSQKIGDDAGVARSDSGYVTTPIQQETTIESLVNAKPMNQPAANPSSQERDLSPAQRGVSQLIEYVRVLIELACPRFCGRSVKLTPSFPRRQSG